MHAHLVLISSAMAVPSVFYRPVVAAFEERGWDAIALPHTGFERGEPPASRSNDWSYADEMQRIADAVAKARAEAPERTVILIGHSLGSQISAGHQLHHPPADGFVAIGASVPQGAAFQFGIESQPRTALLTFEVGGADIDAPPEVYVNGASLGPVTLAMPDLADPGYRGEMKALVSQMHFQYTGWIRAQKLVAASNLRVGSNDLLVTGGPGTKVSAIRATQIQLKYLWEKLDYQLVPRR